MQAGKVIRITVASLSISAAGWLGIINSEWYTRDAIVPTKNDRPTYGLGSTFKEDGSPVKMGDKIDPVPAIRLSINHIAKDEAGLKRCVTGDLSQVEYDILVDHAYQYGAAATCSSAMVRYINTGEYRESCEAYTEFKYLTTKNPTQGWEPYKFDANDKPARWRFDCSKPGNKVCRGVWLRTLERRNKCLEAQ